MTIFRQDLLHGKAALVTGASRGLGREIALALAGHGARVAFHSRKAQLDLAEHHGGVAIGADLAIPGAGSQLVQEAAERLGRIDMVIHAAAGRTDGRDVVPGDEGPVELYRQVLVEAAYEMAASAHARGARYILHIGSIAGFAGAEAGGYGEAKAELHSLTRKLAREMAPATLVNCIAPGPVEAGGGLLLTPEERSAYAAEIPLGRLAVSADVTNLVLYLVSGGSDYLTGQTFSLTGGWVMR